MLKLKDMNADQLVEAIDDESGAMYTWAVDAAMRLSARLHAGQIRKDPVQGRISTPYIEHCLRGILRLIRLTCKPERSEARLIAIALHDCVEDCARVFAPHTETEVEARELLREHILAEFGAEALEYIDDVTNAYQSRSERGRLTDAEKFVIYRDHVTHVIRRSVGTFLVKFVDLVDNAGSLHHTPTERAPKARRLAFKYNPLIPEFRAAAAKHALTDDTVDWAEIDAVLARMGGRLDVIIAAEQS